MWIISQQCSRLRVNPSTPILIQAGTTLVCITILERKGILEVNRGIIPFPIVELALTGILPCFILLAKSQNL